MAADVDIINLALDRIGQAQISSMSQTTGNAPLAVRNYYNERDTLLYETYWTFARAEIALTPITNVWQRWQNAYVYPNDCLRINNLFVATAQGGAIPYQTYWEGYTPVSLANVHNIPHEIVVITDVNNVPTGQKALLCNLDNAYMYYTRQITDANQFPAPFRNLLILKVAKALSHTLITNPGVQDRIDRDIYTAQSLAVRSSAQDMVEARYPMSSFEDARY